MASAKTYYIYMMTNKTRTVLYTGVTNSLLRRVWQHREGRIAGFASRYNCDCLVYHESFRDIRNAIAREKQIKGWRREKKNALVADLNPKWVDLSEMLLGLGPAPRTRWVERQRLLVASEIPRPAASG